MADDLSQWQLRAVRSVTHFCRDQCKRTRAGCPNSTVAFIIFHWRFQAMYQTFVNERLPPGPGGAMPVQCQRPDVALTSSWGVYSSGLRGPRRPGGSPCTPASSTRAGLKMPSIEVFTIWRAGSATVGPIPSRGPFNACRGALRVLKP